MTMLSKEQIQENFKARIANLTEEDRALMRAKRLQKIEQEKAEAVVLKQDFKDANHWGALASKYGVKMPAWYKKTTPKIMRKFLKKLDVSPEQYKYVSGDKTLAKFAELNPSWPAWAWVGLLLEYLENKDIIPGKVIQIEDIDAEPETEVEGDDDMDEDLDDA